MKLTKEKYDELVAGIEYADMYDGRECGVDIYRCDKCGCNFFTRYKDKGVTPLTIKCRNCNSGTAFHEDSISEMIASSLGVIVHNWVRPTFEQLMELDDCMVEHVLNGGLMLEDELPNHPMTNEQKDLICKIAKVKDIGDLSDGFHTFNDLYHQRVVLFAALVKAYRKKAWKSWKHEDGKDCFGGGWFIVGIDTPDGSYTYHYEEKYWQLFDCITLERAKHWDGHTSKDVTRLLSLQE